MKNAFVFAAMLTVFCAIARSADDAADSKRFVQDRFTIGLWVAPATKENLPQHYQEIADANFTLVIGTDGMTPAEQLAICDKCGLKAIVSGTDPVEKFADGPACWGYLLSDEPGPGGFPGLAKKADEVRKLHPGRFGYINLLPNYAPEWAIGTKGYDDYVAKFIREVKPEVLSMDHYPLMRPDGDTRINYCQNLETFRKQSIAAGIPFWNFFYCMPFGDRMDPTEAQIRWQIFTSVAYGAKGVLYFCYWTPGKGAAGGGEFPKGGAIITAEGLKTRHYDEARRINAELKNLGPTLMQLTSTGVYRVNTESGATTLPAGSPLVHLKKIAGDPRGDFTVGTFKVADGRRAVVIVNDSYSQTAWPTVEFDVDAKDVMEVDKMTGKAAAVVDDSPEMKGLQLSFGAGDGRLFLLPAGK